MSFFKRMFLTIMITLFCVIGAIAATKATTTSTPTTDAAATSTNSNRGTVSDTAITAYLKTKMLMSSQAFSDVSVSTTNGVVSLSGSIASQKDANNLIDMIKKTNGIKDVDASNLKIKKIK